MEDVTKAEEVPTPEVRKTEWDLLNETAEDGKFDNNVYGVDPYA